MSLAMYLLTVSMFSVLAPRTVAQTFDNPAGVNTWVAPPLEDVNIGINALLAIATVIQLAIAITFPFRVQSQHVAPGITAIIALLSMFLSYVLYIVVLVVTFIITDDFGDLVVSQQVYNGINTAGLLFFSWTEPVLFLTIAFVIRDRYLTYGGKERDGENKSGLSLFPFMIISYFLVVLIFTLSTANGGLIQASASTDLSITEIETMIKDANYLSYASLALLMVATILLIPMATVARKKAGSDKIMNLTLFAIVPLLLVHAIGRMILVIILSHPPMNADSHFFDATDLAASTVESIPHCIIACILCYFFFPLRLWNRPGGSNSQPYYVSGYQQQPSLQGGMPPVGQFPGQWIYPGMPEQQQQQVPMNSPYQTYPLQQGAGGHYPNQQPATSGPGVAGGSPPVDEKSQGYATEVQADTA